MRFIKHSSICIGETNKCQYKKKEDKGGYIGENWFHISNVVQIVDTSKT